MRCVTFGIILLVITIVAFFWIAGWVFVSLEWTDGQSCEELTPSPWISPQRVVEICGYTPTEDELAELKCQGARKELIDFDRSVRPNFLTARAADILPLAATLIAGDRHPFETRVSELCPFTPTPSMTATPTPTATYTATALPTSTATSSPTITPIATPTKTALETPMTSYPNYMPTPNPTMMPKPFPEYDSPTVIPNYPTPQPTWEPSPVVPVVAPTPTITPTPSPVTIPVVIDIQEPQQPSIENDPNYWVILAGISAVLAQIAVILGVIYRIKHNKEP